MKVIWCICEIFAVTFGYKQKTFVLPHQLPVLVQSLPSIILSRTLTKTTVSKQFRELIASEILREHGCPTKYVDCETTGDNISILSLH